MVTSTFDIRDGSRINAARATRTDRECLRYRLDVIAVSALDVVQSAGGWLYDRAMAGWRVTVLLPDGSGARSLRILGVQVLDLEEQLAAMDPGSTSQDLAVSAEAFTADARGCATGCSRRWTTGPPKSRCGVKRLPGGPYGWIAAWPGHSTRSARRRGDSRAMRWQRPGWIAPQIFTATLFCRFGDLWTRRLGAGPARLMKKYYRHALLYLHETISLGSGRSDRFTEVFSETYRPMMDELGARLFAIWETTPYNGHWPQVTIIWEIDGFADYARIGAAQARGGSQEAAAGKWSAFLADTGAAGEGRIMYPGPSNKNLAQLRDAKFVAPLVIQEIMQTKPGRQDDYIRELERLYVPWSERTGKRWLGSFTTTFRYNEVIHYWALDGGWECFANHYPSWKESPPAEIVTWMSVAPALRDGWEDSILQALPPSPLQ